MFHTGQQIGPYTLVKRIGRGGFGEVWQAERRTEIVTTQVAVKLPLNNSIDLESVKQEAKIWAMVSGHPNILPIIEANIYDGQIVIVSEYAPDGSLAKKLSRGMTIKEGIDMTLGILSGLEFLHSRQIIHRDLKPENILLQGDTPRLADFGISRAMKTTNISSTIIGTPKYMAPEAFDGKRSRQTDIWSVGVILYLLLTGGLPFRQENSTDLLGAIVLKEPDPLPPSTPESLKRVVMCALAKRAEDRYKSANEMRKDLLEALNDPSYANAMVHFLPQPIPVYSSVIMAARTPTSLQEADIPTSAAPQMPQPTTRPAQNAATKNYLRILLVALPLLFLLFFLGGASILGIYYFYSVANGRSQASPQDGPATQPASAEDMYAPGKMKEVIEAFEKEAGGKLKVAEFYIYPNAARVTAEDPKDPKNFIECNYVGGNVKKESVIRLAQFDKDEAFFSFSEISFDAIPTLAKVAKDKDQSVGGIRNTAIRIYRPLPFSTEVVIQLFISGANKDILIEANAKGEIKNENN